MLTWLAAYAATCHLGSGVAHGATEVLGNQTRQSHGAYAHIEATVLLVTLRSMCQGCKRRDRAGGAIHEYGLVDSFRHPQAGRTRTIRARREAIMACGALLGS